METFLLDLLKTSLLGSLAVLAMLALKPLWRERYRAKTRCWLWLALALFLLFPIDFSVKNAPVQAEPPKDYTVLVGTEKTTVMATDNLFGDMAESSGRTPTEVRDAINERPVTNPEQKTTRYIPVTALLFGGYLAGAAAFLLYQGGCYLHFRRTVRRWKRSVSRADYASLLCDTARELQVNAPEMIVCEAVTTPAVTGLFRPRLLLPHERYDVQELRYILRHELCHLKRRDMLFKLVLLAANAMHWFNPIVYLMLRQADEDIELACDSAATDGLTTPERAAYSRTLLAAVQSNVRALPATTYFGGTVERLKRRITNVLGAQKKRGLGIVAIVLALTLAAGCATSWGERAQANNPFDGTTFAVDEAVYLATEARNAARGFPYSPAITFRALTVDSEKRVTMFAPSGDEFVFSPMEVTSLDKSTFPALFNDSADEAWNGMSADELISGNQTVWKGSVSDATYEDYYNVLYLFAQKDGSFYVGLAYQTLGSDSGIKAIEGIGSVYRLNIENTDTIYDSMDDYAAARVEQLKQGTMEYYVRTNHTGVVKDSVADVRVTQLEFADSLGNLSPDGTVLELWYFQYEMKPTNEAGVQIDLVGGQIVTDDGYLNENETHYLTVLHSEAGYQIIGTTMSNDGLFYNGCGYDDDTAAYLHDVYTDYAGLDRLKMYIPDLLDETIPDGYGYVNRCEARLISGDGYCFYAPMNAWACNPGTEYWYSRYDTGSYFSVTRIEKDIDAALKEWTRAGYEVERIASHYRIVTHEGLSNTVVTLYPLQDGSCYQIETHWLFDGSTEENEWGWNHDRAVEQEAAILQAMTDSFTVTVKILPVQDTVDAVPDDSDFRSDLRLASNGGAAWMYLSKGNTEIGDRDMLRVTPTIRLDECSYALLNEEFTPDDGKQTLTLWLSNNDSSHLAFFEGTDIMLYQRDGAQYYKVSNYGDYATLYDAMLAWYNSAVQGDTGTQTNASPAANTVTRDSIIKSAGSYVDYGGYLWYTAGGKLCRWREGGSVETLRELPYNDVTDQPAIATLAVEYDQVALRWHIGGATTGTTMLELYGADGKQTMELDGSAPFAISGNTIVKLRSFPPTTGNLLLSIDGGKTWTIIGDANWFYGSVTEDSSGSTSYALADLTIRDGYVYTTAVYDIEHQKTSDPLVTRSVRVNLTTGAQEILD